MVHSLVWILDNICGVGIPLALFQGFLGADHHFSGGSSQEVQHLDHTHYGGQVPFLDIPYTVIQRHLSHHQVERSEGGKWSPFEASGWGGKI